MSPPKIYGLIGYPVKHSFSPLMHNAAFKALKINAEYRLFSIEPKDLEAFLLGEITVQDTNDNTIHSKDVVGFNITIPHKVKAREILEREFPFDKSVPVMNQDLYYVKITGAINTVKRNQNKIEYRNTDAVGFLQSLQELNFEPKGKNVLLIGCGGAGRAIIAGLGWWKDVGVNKIYINDINTEAVTSTQKQFESASHLTNKLQFISTEQIPEVIRDCQLLINATAIGMKENDPALLEEKIIHRGLLVYDLIYNPKETKLLKIAKEKGAQTSNGLGMLLYQGEAAFEFWTELKRKTRVVEVMRKALTEALYK